MNVPRTGNGSSILRTAVAFGASAALTIGLVVAVGGPLAAGSPAAAAQGGDTYVLSDFSVAYPYLLGPRGETATADSEGVGDPTKVGVAFTASWSGTDFPGQSWCEVSVDDSSGREVGRARFLAAYATPTALPPILAVDVSGEPSTAEGACGAGSYPAGEGYVFDNVRVDDGPEADQAEISFDTHWLGQDAPGWRSCSVAVQLSGGQDLAFDFGYHAPDRSSFTHVIDARPDDIVQATTTCTELGQVERS